MDKQTNRRTDGHTHRTTTVTLAAHARRGLISWNGLAYATTMGLGGGGGWVGNLRYLPRTSFSVKGEMWRGVRTYIAGLKYCKCKNMYTPLLCIHY